MVYPLVTLGICLYSWNMPYIRFSQLPKMNIAKAETASWAKEHIMGMFSEHDRGRCGSLHHHNPLIGYKKSLLSLFGAVMGFDCPPRTTFAITCDRNQEPLMLFVTGVYLDPSSHTVVASVYASTVLAEAPGEVFQINVNSAVMTYWRTVLPSMAERCRDWEHRSECQYLKPPSSAILEGDHSFCSCGVAKVADDFLNALEWKQYIPFVTRIAVSPVFPVPSLEPQTTRKEKFRSLFQYVLSWHKSLQPTTTFADRWQSQVCGGIPNYSQYGNCTQSASTAGTKYEWRNMVDCDHSPLPCVPVPRIDQRCAIQPMKTLWNTVDRVMEKVEGGILQCDLVKAGGHKARISVGMTKEGFGMTSATSVLSAFRRCQQAATIRLDHAIQVCDQCKPGTNTFTYYGGKYERCCDRIEVRLAGRPLHIGERVLCIAANGGVDYCAKGEFMAVSHVWEHGWRGVSEDGICSRVLHMLCKTASQFGLSWIWIDVAMISGVREIRALSVNSMHRVYSSAAVTLV